jgi:hypothetical protein
LFSCTIWILAIQNADALELDVVLWRPVKKHIEAKDKNESLWSRELVSFWWLCPLDHLVDIDHLQDWERAEALDLGNWWITAPLASMSYTSISEETPLRKVGDALCPPVLPSFMFLSCSEKKLGKTVSMLPTRSDLHKHKSLKNHCLVPEHIWIY